MKKSKFDTTMVDISLNCLLLLQDDKNCEFTIVTNTANSVGKFEKDIKEEIKGAGNDIFNDNEADHLKLWQVWIGKSDKDKISNLTLDTKSKELEGIIGDYWAEQPCKESIHVIVYSPYLRKLNSLTISSQGRSI